MKQYLIPIVICLLFLGILVTTLLFSPRTSTFFTTDTCSDRFIPKIVHQTFATANLPIEIEEIMNQNKVLNPDYQFVFYDDNDCDKFIKDNFNDRIYRLYNKINPVYGAMKADFFRYCVIYILGGVYIDIKTLIKTPLKDIITQNDTCILDIPKHLDTERFFNGKFSYEQWLLIYAPKHSYLKEVIDSICFNIANEYEPDSSFFSHNTITKHKIINITGPDAYTKAINKFIDSNGSLHRNIDFNLHFKMAGTTSYKKMYEQNNKKHYSALNQPLYLANKIIIPKNIFMTWKTKYLPQKMKENFDFIQLSNPDFNVYLYEDDDSRVLIEDYFDEEVLNAYDTLIPGAYKADLWRLCVLYIYGGIYMDMRYNMNSNNLRNLLYDEHFTQDLSSSGHGIYNAFMVCKPGNKFLLDCISKILDNIKKRFYGNNSLYVTGPMMMKEVMETNNNKLNIDLKLSIKPHKVLLYNGSAVATGYDEYENERSNFSDKHYNILWKEQNIFKDNNTKSENKQKINLFQTHKSWEYIQSNPDLYKAVNSWKHYENVNYQFYDDIMCDAFMLEHFPGDIYEAYIKLPIAVMKADLWRYCVIYKFGGIYADSDTICKTNPGFLVSDALLTIVPENDDVHLCQWFFSAKKDSIILKYIIDLSVKRILETDVFEGEHFIFNLTGPTCFTDAIEKFLKEHHLPYFENRLLYFNYPNTNVLKVFDPIIFHSNTVIHLFTGAKKGGWQKERDTKFLNYI